MPWFLEQMPAAYFADTDQSARMTHLGVLAAARASGLPPGTTLTSTDESGITFLSERDYPGLLAELMRILPKDKPLRAVKVHTSKDGTLSLNTVVIGETARADLNDPVQAAKVKEILAGVKEEDLAAVERHLRGASVDYVRSVTPLRALRTWQRFAQVSGTDDTLVFLEDEAEPNASRIIIAVPNTTPRRMFHRVSALLGRRNVDIRRAYLEVFEDPGNGAVSMLSFVVLGPDRTAPINADSKFWALLSSELSRLKWVNDAAIDLDKADSALGLVRSEIAVALGSLTHQILSRENAYAFAKDRVISLVTKNAAIASSIAQLLLDRFNPEKPLDDATFDARAAEIHETMERTVEGEDSRRVLGTMVAAVKATLRTNVHLTARYGLALRLDPVLMARPEHPETPYGVFFVHGRGFDGFHVRFRDIARGGVRVVRPMGPDQLALETDRLYDEVYGLASAQQLKNKDIPEGGAKAVIVAAPDIGVSRVVKGFVDGLLDLIVPDPDGKIVDRFKKPELLYLGPDENITPEHIDWIVDRAKRRGYPLYNAFMSSKPGAGINHKVYGVTSEGVTVFLEVALNAVGIDPRKQPFTVKLTGGPDGDVAGNEIKILQREYGGNARIVGIADGSGSAEDPDGLDHGELLRLVQLSLPIADYERSKLGPRGVLAKVSDPSGVKLRNTLHNRVVADAFIPAGGRPKTIHGQNWQQFLLADGRPSSRVIIEGANLFLTPEARKKLGEAGVLVVKDSSANKCGVICSSFEISASMILSAEEFLAVKPRFVAEVLEKLRALARREAELLFREYARSPGLDLPELSVRLSKVINRAADAIEGRLGRLTEDEQVLTRSLVLNHLPKVLTDNAKDRIFTKLPPAYIRSIIGASLAAEIIYREGLDYLAPVPDAVLGDLAIRYLRREQETRALIETVKGSTLRERDQIVKVLERAGTRAALES